VVDDLDLAIYTDSLSSSPPLPDGKYVAKALLELQYFPFVKDEDEELPPLFSTSDFTQDVAVEIDALPQSHRERGWVEFRARRFDGLSRRLGIPHPVPYSRLVLHVRDNWTDIQSVLDSTTSVIAPRRHDDGRLIQMNYDTAEESHERHTRLALGMEFMVNADVSNCFPSIYAHSLDWVLRGKAVAKRVRTRRTWQEELDRRTRAMTDGETKGLLIGPAISNVLSEVVLQAVDRELKEFRYTRAVDDYTVFCETREEAERFVSKLQLALATYRLDVNRRKTSIRDLRDGLSDSWMAEVRSHLPDSDGSSIKVVQFIQHAELLAKGHPNRSVMKFAVKSVLGPRAESDSLTVFELTRASHFHPHLLPMLSREIGKLGSTDLYVVKRDLVDPLSIQLGKALDRDETDTVLWLLYIARAQLGHGVRPLHVRAALRLNSDLVWLALMKLRLVSPKRLANYMSTLSLIEQSDFDEHWLGRYELFRRGLLAKPKAFEEPWMTVLAGRGVRFVRRGRLAKAKP